MKIAKEKLGAVEENSAKVKVMEKTGLAFMEANYAKILNALQQLK